MTEHQINEDADIDVEGRETDSSEDADEQSMKSEEARRVDATEDTMDGLAEAPVEAPASGAGRDRSRTDPSEELEELNDRHLRLVAEFNNYRRRSEQERLAAWSRAQADLVGKFLDVLDDLHRVAELDLSNATVEAIMEGIDLVERKFVRIVQDAGVEMLDPAGAPFDPELMEAVMRVPAESEEQVDTVAQVFQKGYSLKGILVRPARVSVYTEG
jgi:molecular chaperone GrpE